MQLKQTLGGVAVFGVTALLVAQAVSWVLKNVPVVVSVIQSGTDSVLLSAGKLSGIFLSAFLVEQIAIKIFGSTGYDKKAWIATGLGLGVAYAVFMFTGASPLLLVVSAIILIGKRIYNSLAPILFAEKKTTASSNINIESLGQDNNELIESLGQYNNEVDEDNMELKKQLELSETLRKKLLEQITQKEQQIEEKDEEIKKLNKIVDPSQSLNETNSHINNSFEFNPNTSMLVNTLPNQVFNDN